MSSLYGRIGNFWQFPFIIGKGETMAEPQGEILTLDEVAAYLKAGKRTVAYLSAEYHENWRDNEAGNPHGCVLLGAGLVTRPCIKRLDPVQLSEADGESVLLLHPKLLNDLISEVKDTMKKHLEEMNSACSTGMRQPA